MSQVGIPIKLLYEAEGMKVTVEVGLLVYIVFWLYLPPAFYCMLCCLNIILYAHLVYQNAKKFSHGFRLSPPCIYPVQIYYMI